MQKMIDIKAKNPRVREFLLSTDDKTLIEATGDSYWACGATFRSKKVQENNTSGKNKLGKLWMEKRTQLKESEKMDTPTVTDKTANAQTKKADDVMPPLEGDN